MKLIQKILLDLFGFMQTKIFYHIFFLKMTLGNVDDKYCKNDHKLQMNYELGSSVL